LGELVVNDIEALTTPLQDWDFKNSPKDPFLFAQEMVSEVWNNNGLGIAANQLGYPWKVFAMRGQPENFCCFNPRIVMPSTETIVLEEGCLSFPGLVFKIRRPQHVRVRFAAPTGEVMTRMFTGMTARVFQHEMTHMNAQIFFAGLSRLKIDTAIKKAKKLGVDYTGMNLLRYAK